MSESAERRDLRQHVARYLSSAAITIVRMRRERLLLQDERVMPAGI